MSDTIIINTNIPYSESVIIDQTQTQNSIIIDKEGYVISVNGKKGVVVLLKSDIGLDQVDNTSDLNKPISYDTLSALLLKTDLGLFLTLNDYVTSNSINWNSVYSNVNFLSSNWNSSYSTLCSLSSNWNSVYSNVSLTSSNWNSVYSSVSLISSNWNSSYSTLCSLSSNWNSVYSSVSLTSSRWITLPTVTNYLSTSNVLISSAQINNTLLVPNINKNIVTTTYTGNLFGYTFSPLINSLNSVAYPSLLTSSNRVSAGLMTRQAGIGGFASTIGWGSTNYAVGGSNTINDAIAANEWFSIPVFSNQINNTITISSIGSFFMIRSPAGPKSIAFGYNNSVDNPSTATYLSLGVNAIPVNDVMTDISPAINAALASSPITITPGVTSYLYIIPYQATGNGGTLRFQGGSAPYDLYFAGQSVSVDGSNASLNLNGNVTLTGNLSSTNDIEVTDFNKGIILKSPNSTKWRITVNNSGTLISTSVS